MTKTPSNRAQRTHCKNGHPQTPENLRIYEWQGRQMRNCRLCSNESGKRWRNNRSPQEKREYQRAWRKKNLEKNRAHKRAYRQRNYKRVRQKNILGSRKRNEIIRDRILDIYGRQCVRCKFTDVRALQLDHKKGNAKNYEHAGRKFPFRGVRIYRHILLGHIPESDFQLLCANCNWIKRHENGEFNRRLSDEELQ